MSIKLTNKVWQLNSLKSSSKMVLLALADYANDEEQCWPSIDSLSKKCSMSRSTVITQLNKLAELNLITKQHRNDEYGYRRSSLYNLNLNSILSLENQRRNNQSRNFEHQSLKMPPSKVLNPDGNNINHQEPPIESSNITQAPDKTLVQNIFQHWQQVMSHPNAKLDKKREAKIKAALKLGYSVEQLKLAIDGCANTPFNMGENTSNQRYDDISLILRDAEHIEKFVEQASKLTTNKQKADTSYNETISGAI